MSPYPPFRFVRQRIGAVKPAPLLVARDVAALGGGG
jgi:hypothetical protein